VTIATLPTAVITGGDGNTFTSVPLELDADKGNDVDGVPDMEAIYSSDWIELKE
jgi:hypothetical protein